MRHRPTRQDDSLADGAASGRLRPGRRPLLLFAVAICLIAPATALALRLRSHPHAARPSRAAIPSSRTTPGVPEIGALFPNATTSQHDCTAGVVDSPSGNVLITAAHCVVGSGVGMVFVPAFRNGSAPFGRWTVTAVHAAPGWRVDHDPNDDVAFLTVARRRIDGRLTAIQTITGGYRLGSTARRGAPITVTGYPAGAANSAITCSTRVYLTGAFPSFDCRGYVDGTSGTPWIHRTRHGAEIVGVIGGLHQGGCVDFTSYSSPLAGDAHHEYELATAGDPGDVDPAATDDGCS